MPSARSGTPPTHAPERERLKAQAAARAAELVRDGMLLGLGTGSTAAFFVEEVGRRVAQGMRLVCVPTSESTARQAAELGISLTHDVDRALDLAVDGADEIDPARSLVKGRGGALFREKLVAVNADRFVVIADDSKLVQQLGHGPMPVEVLPFLWKRTALRLADLGGHPVLRQTGDGPYRTDNGNLILDLHFEHPLGDPAGVARELKSLVGVVEHGLYIGIAAACVVAGDGGTRILGSLD